MIETIRIDLAAIKKDCGDRAEEVAERVLNKLEAFARNRINVLAAKKVQAEKMREYIDALKSTRTRLRVVITLDNPAIEKLDSGSPRWSIAKAMLRSAGAKQGKSGPYIDVPFLHSVLPRSKGTPVPQDMKAAVMAAMDHVRRTGGAKRLFRKTKGQPTTRQTDMKVAAADVPQASKAMPSAKTFRRISERSDPSKWWYPAKEGLKIFEQVRNEIEQIKDRVVHDTVAEKVK